MWNYEVLQWISSLKKFKHAFLYYRGRKVKHYYFSASLAARVPAMIGPTIRCTHLRLPLGAEFANTKRGSSGVILELATVHVFLIQQAASQSGRQRLDYSKSSSFFGSPLWWCGSYKLSLGSVSSALSKFLWAIYFPWSIPFSLIAQEESMSYSHESWPIQNLIDRSKVQQVKGS